MILDHTCVAYKEIQSRLGANKYNGAYYYSKEIVQNIIPRIDTDRNWLTVNTKDYCPAHTVVFIHNNKFPHIYDWLQASSDLVLVCGIETTCGVVEHLGTPLYLPLSVDVDYVKQFKKKKTREIAFVGRSEKRSGISFHEVVDIIENVEREALLWRMAEYKRVFAVGRTAIEAKILGCEVLPYDQRFPNPDLWKVMDNSEAAEILQAKLNEIDG